MKHNVVVATARWHYREAYKYKHGTREHARHIAEFYRLSKQALDIPVNK